MDPTLQKLFLASLELIEAFATIDLGKVEKASGATYSRGLSGISIVVWPDHGINTIDGPKGQEEYTRTIKVVPDHLEIWIYMPSFDEHWESSKENMHCALVYL
ncbi:predicted protein [Lichtheimia corymbifera JMRC:FSU:9682]|uniref:Uncharacterized protein n=1 Tax=Lichtheimia corymbifera JMRC:FSU:9682 TaxID=1263082 RepID=A0A068RQY8_9FUNG|nr:predicted protein [Lichtheimia corymbifera JMRC:FSU:9682]